MNVKNSNLIAYISIYNPYIKIEDFFSLNKASFRVSTIIIDAKTFSRIENKSFYKIEVDI